MGWGGGGYGGGGRYRMNALRVLSALEVRRVVPSGDLRGG